MDRGCSVMGSEVPNVSRFGGSGDAGPTSPSAVVAISYGDSTFVARTFLLVMIAKREMQGFDRRVRCTVAVVWVGSVGWLRSNPVFCVQDAEDTPR